MWGIILADLKALVSKLESMAYSLWTDIEQAFPAAEQAAIKDLMPLAQQIISDLDNQGGLTGKQIVAEALSQIETALINAGKDFVITLATQAIAIEMAKQGIKTAAGNSGNLAGGTQTGG